MGNNESYTQVAVPQGSENIGDVPQDDLTFVFHTTDDDTPDRVVHDFDDDIPVWPYVITSSGRLIAERREFKKPFPISELVQHAKPGDIVEFVKPGKRFHWAVYVGDDRFIHLKNDKILDDSADHFSSQINLQGRIVNQVYKMKTLPAVQVVNNARTQVGKPSIWNSSESFTMWCRTGKAEFTLEETQIHNLDSMTPKSTKGKYMAEFHTQDETVMRRFQTLSALIEYRRNVEKFGKDFLINKEI